MGSPNLVFILLSHKKKSDDPEKFRKLHVIVQKGHGPLAYFVGHVKYIVLHCCIVVFRPR